MRRVNNNIATIITSIVIISVFLMAGLADYIQSHYDRQAIVISNIDNDILAMDAVGYVWEFYADDLSIDDTITLKMDTNHTDNIITDDNILGYEVITL